MKSDLRMTSLILTPFQRVDLLTADRSSMPNCETPPAFLQFFSFVIEFAISYCSSRIIASSNCASSLSMREGPVLPGCGIPM